jgi:ATP/maltotriose-dependent transcriptional regulator MalT
VTLNAALAWKPVAALLTAQRGAAEHGERMIRDLLSNTPDDAVFRRAQALLALAELLRDGDAQEAVAAAVALYECKGNAVAARGVPSGAPFASADRVSLAAAASR